MSDTTKVEGIRIEETINLEVSGGFYARLHQLLQSMMKSVPVDEFNRAVESIKSGKPASEYAYHLMTVMTLINGIESAAKEQGKITMNEMKPSP